MSNDLKHTIYSPGDCLSEKMLFDYIDNKLSHKERHIVEKHLLDCEMCSDALEGLEMVSDRNRISLIKEAINKRISESTKKEAVVVSFNYKMAFSIAATIALLIVGVFFFNKINLKEATMSSDMAELKENESPAPPPPPLDEAENNATDTTDEASPTTGVKGEESKLTPSKIISQEIALSDVEEQKPGFYKNKEGIAENRNQETVAPAESSGNGTITTFDATITPKDDKLNNQLETVSIPKTSAPEREKDAKLDDTKKAEEKTVAGASGGTYSWSTGPDQKQKNTADNNTVSGEKIELAKKTETAGKSRSEGKLFEEKGKSKKAQVVTKETRGDNKDEDGNFRGNVAYEPQSVTQDKAKAADEESEQLKSEVLANTSTTKTVTDSIEHVFSVVEQMPEYPGGTASMMKFISKNISIDKSQYIETQSNITKVYVQFVIDKDGSILNPKIIKAGNPVLDKEALRIVKMMPKWNPGKQNGKPVPVLYNLPIQMEIK